MESQHPVPAKPYSWYWQDTPNCCPFLNKGNKQPCVFSFCRFDKSELHIQQLSRVWSLGQKDKSFNGPGVPFFFFPRSNWNDSQAFIFLVTCLGNNGMIRRSSSSWASDGKWQLLQSTALPPRWKSPGIVFMTPSTRLAGSLRKCMWVTYKGGPAEDYWKLDPSWCLCWAGQRLSHVLLSWHHFRTEDGSAEHFYFNWAA